MGRARRAVVIETLHDVATTIQTEETVTGVCERTVAAAADLLDFNLCTIVIRDGEWLVPRATSADAPSDGSQRMRVDEGLAGKTYQTGESYTVAEVTPDDETVPADASYRSGISVPIGDHGVFQAVETTAGAFDEDDIELAELLVSHAATALDRLDRERELQRQNERLDQFASVVSHDLRNPLNVARGRLELAAEDCSSPHLDPVEEAHERMERLIDDLLLFAKMGSETLSVASVDLATLAADCWDPFSTATATLDVECDHAVRADRARLRQLLENLFTNALDHGGDDVSVTVGELPQGFYVADDGPGIPPGDRDDVFTAGYTSGDDGTGFGLSIVSQIADAHGWDVAMTESASGGSRFEIRGVDVVEQ
ncbi:multi-sensor signal transduction histidine kinase [Halorubrum californiense DSM 19288]|uniref:histidine kinase n=1 Tax=Halorubrum californiense DSM 19288 TaxID=1227465 RepID=M0EAI6_9EURY|nr:MULTISPECIES: GAF domain-containing sensor histidine kinase [Halorubrum]ELZ44821.1 multi-sensor signal transduction histidine kinase [Halorubrum californiense DSM 19288]TKX70698.1 GAF domain-containing protein [Halorubrum sp. GN11GM_10-3_MGM]